MRVVFFNTYNQSFLSGFFLELCDELSLRGHRVHVICLKGIHQVIERPSGVTVVVHKRQSKAKNYVQIFRLVKHYKPDVAVSNFSYVNPVVLSSWILGVKNNIVWFHTLKNQMNFNSRQIFIKSKFMKLSSKIITNSNELRQEVIAEYGQRNEKVIAIPFTTSIYNLESRPINLIKDEPLIYLGCPGRIDSDKNQKMLIDLLVHLNDMRYRVVFAGKNNLDVLKNHDHYESKKNQLVFLGNLSKEEMVSFYDDMDVIILPSLNEAFGLVLIEALASGSKTLVSHRFGALDYIKDHVEDLVFDPNNVHDLATKLKRTLSNNHSKSYYKNIYFKYFSMDNVVKQFLSTIDCSRF
ncbi:MAG: glycosyltransferase family 4 protein [Psychroserpens sp.]|uniref:glycosyltransferase family 4 protein n=1 Tax=Psychroserpens sp. TaxID=2020870 RepID=UPI003C8406EA